MSRHPTQGRRQSSPSMTTFPPNSQLHGHLAQLASSFTWWPHKHLPTSTPCKTVCNILETPSHMSWKSSHATHCPHSSTYPPSYMPPANGPNLSSYYHGKGGWWWFLTFMEHFKHLQKQSKCLITQVQKLATLTNTKEGSGIPSPSSCLHCHSWRRALSTSYCSTASPSLLVPQYLNLLKALKGIVTKGKNKTALFYNQHLPFPLSFKHL